MRRVAIIIGTLLDILFIVMFGILVGLFLIKAKIQQSLTGSISEINLKRVIRRMEANSIRPPKRDVIDDEDIA